MQDQSKKLIHIIEHILKEDETIEVLSSFDVPNANDLWIKGKIALTLRDIRLDFEVHISTHFPMEMYGNDSAFACRFYCSSALGTVYLNGDNSICIHTPFCPNASIKFLSEIEALKTWMQKYYISKEIDERYSYLLLPYNQLQPFMQIWFTDIEATFSAYEYGLCDFFLLNDLTYVIAEFRTNHNKGYKCKWSNLFAPQNIKKQSVLWVFLDKEPVIDMKKRNPIDNWQYLWRQLSPEFQNLFYKKHLSTPFLLIGFYTNKSANEVHWEAVKIPIELFSTQKDKKGHYLLNDYKIDWIKTTNVSYNRFFGRGKLHNKLTHSKILIIGVGAIGSQLAESLVRGGITNLTIRDFDGVETGNICRSIFDLNGVSIPKSHILLEKLLSISPFVEILSDPRSLNSFLPNSFEWYNLQKEFDKFDFIFDCTANNSLCYTFNNLELKNAQLFSLSIANQAKVMACLKPPNLYALTQTIFEPHSKDDLLVYEGTGCHYPTFQASYSDIALLVQYFIKKINFHLTHNHTIKSFSLSYVEDGFDIKVECTEY